MHTVSCMHPPLMVAPMALKDHTTVEALVCEVLQVTSPPPGTTLGLICCLWQMFYWRMPDVWAMARGNLTVTIALFNIARSDRAAVRSPWAGQLS